jgi:hypothetical protein
MWNLLRQIRNKIFGEPPSLISLVDSQKVLHGVHDEGVVLLSKGHEFIKLSNKMLSGFLNGVAIQCAYELLLEPYRNCQRDGDISRSCFKDELDKIDSDTKLQLALTFGAAVIVQSAIKAVFSHLNAKYYPEEVFLEAIDDAIKSFSKKDLNHFVMESENESDPREFLQNLESANIDHSAISKSSYLFTYFALQLHNNEDFWKYPVLAVAKSVAASLMVESHKLISNCGSLDIGHVHLFHKSKFFGEEFFNKMDEESLVNPEILEQFKDKISLMIKGKADYLKEAEKDFGLNSLDSLVFLSFLKLIQTSDEYVNGAKWSGANVGVFMVKDVLRGVVEGSFKRNPMLSASVSPESVVLEIPEESPLIRTGEDGGKERGPDKEESDLKEVPGSSLASANSSKIKLSKSNQHLDSI